jgi:3-deoxy-D-manno-octulosonate 8-phosphate phosphatase KdsC-like HAD superfamily phosphatase
MLNKLCGTGKGGTPYTFELVDGVVTGTNGPIMNTNNNETNHFSVVDGLAVKREYSFEM